jgi:hypothetical protein
MPPIGKAFIVSSNSGTNMPGAAQPRSPPCAALPSSEFSRASCSKVLLPAVICRLNSASRRTAASGVSWADGRSRMWRAWVCVTENAPALRRSSSFSAWKPAPVRNRVGASSPGFKPRTCSTNTSGKRSAGISPMTPPRALLPSSEICWATVSKGSPALTRATAASMRARRSATTASPAPSGTVTRICAMLYWVDEPAWLRCLSSSASISASVMRIRACTSRSRMRSIMIWSRRLLRKRL